MKPLTSFFSKGSAPNTNNKAKVAPYKPTRQLQLPKVALPPVSTRTRSKQVPPTTSSGEIDAFSTAVAPAAAKQDTSTAIKALKAAAREKLEAEAKVKQEAAAAREKIYAAAKAKLNPAPKLQKKVVEEDDRNTSAEEKMEGVVEETIESSFDTISNYSQHGKGKAGLSISGKAPIKTTNSFFD